MGISNPGLPYCVSAFDVHYSLKMGTNIGQVMTLANSIIGVSVLAMPFCFKQCGILLSVLLLCLSSFLSRFACRFLLQAAIITRRRNYEFLAFHVFGPSGKLCVELSIIGFLLGTCIAFFVVLGDLGPAISSSMFGFHLSDTLRSTILIGVALVVVLPLGLLRNVDSLSSLCTATIAFYLCLVLKVMGEAAIPLMVGDWLSQLNFWRPEGVLQCLPIFSMALFCQTQLFEIFDSIPNAALDKMDAVVRVSVNMCTAVYISVGFFGYVAFSKENITGNILISLSESMSSEVIKLGFFLSVAASFPLVIFPCRASLYSLLYRNAQPPVHDIGATHVPEGRFKLLTLGIVGFSLVVGLFLPNIEQVLGIIGSTIGVTICIITPALLLLNTARQPKDKLSSQIILWTGAIIMILGTYAHILNSETALTEESQVGKVTDLPRRAADHVDNRLIEQAILEQGAKFEDRGLNLAVGGIRANVKKTEENRKLPSFESVGQGAFNDIGGGNPGNSEVKRKEPPVPMETAEKLGDISAHIEKDRETNNEKPKEAPGTNERIGEKRLEPPIPEEAWGKLKEEPVLPLKLKLEAQDGGNVKESGKFEASNNAPQGAPGSMGKDTQLVSVEPMDSVVAQPESIVDGVGAAKLRGEKELEEVRQVNKVEVKESPPVGEQVNQDAIRHEEAELALEGKKIDSGAIDRVNKKEVFVEKKSEEQDLLKKLKEHQEVQRDLLQEQQKILQELKKHESANKENNIKQGEPGELSLKSIKKVDNLLSNIIHNPPASFRVKKIVGNYSRKHNHLPSAISSQQNKTVVGKYNFSPGKFELKEQQLYAVDNLDKNKAVKIQNNNMKALISKPGIVPLPLAYKVSSQSPPKLPVGRDILESPHHADREKREADNNAEQGAGVGPLKEDQQELEENTKKKECSRQPTDAHLSADVLGSNQQSQEPTISKDPSSVPSKHLQSEMVKSESDTKPSSFVRTLRQGPEKLSTSKSEEAPGDRPDKLLPLPLSHNVMELKTPSSISEPQLIIHQNLKHHVDAIGLALAPGVAVPMPTQNMGPKAVEDNH